MKLGYLLISAFFAVLMNYACVKSSTSKHAQLSLESITKTVYSADSAGVDSMTALFKFNNSGGTLGNGTFVSIRQRLNQVAPLIPVGDDTLYSTIPDFGGVSKGEFKYVLDYQGYLGEGAAQHINDTFVFKFFALTPDSLSSDTVTSPQIIVINP